MLTRRTQHLAFLMISPLITGVLLGGIVAENARHLKPADVEPYHARARRAVESIRYNMGYWTGVDDKVPQAAQALLRPNAILSRTYVNNEVGRGRDRWVANLLIVQCRDARDMQGHYPRVCYVTHGESLVRATPRTWRVGTMEIPGTEYLFQSVYQGQARRRYVYNFMIVPHHGIFADMDAIYRSASDYQQRYFGAAQFQVVMDADLPQSERDEIFASLIEPNLEVVRTLLAMAENPKR